MGLSGAVVGQTEPDTLKTEVVIVSEFEPVISAARKITAEPVIDSVEAPKVEFKYENNLKFVETSFTADTIKAAKMKSEGLKRLYKSYLKLGAGNYTSTLADYRINNTRSKSLWWGGGIQHDASRGTDDYLNRYADFGVNGYFIKIWKAHYGTARVNYNQNDVWYYGIDSASVGPLYGENDLNEDALKQRFSNFNAKLTYESFYADSGDLNYKADIEFNRLTNQDGIEENRFLLTTKWEQYFDDQLGMLLFDVDFNQPMNSNELNLSEYKQNILIHIEPHVVAEGEKFRLNAGLGMWMENQTETDFRFYPIAEFKYNVIGNILVPYVGIKGGMERVSYNRLRTENPWVGPSVDIQNQQNRYDAFIGIRGAYSSTVSFNLRASAKQIVNFRTFVNGVGDIEIEPPVPTYDFNVVYDTMNLNHLLVEVAYHEMDRWNLIWRNEYFSYDPTAEVKAWHLPDFKSTLSLSFDMQDKLVLTGDVFFLSDRWARVYDPAGGEELAFGVYGRKLPAYVDVNLGLEYRYNRKIGVFFDARNIASQRYERFNRYAVQGFNFRAGFSYSFMGD
jgi:hypothetical protein